MTADLIDEPSAWRWWEAQRLRYNLGLATGGAIAWAIVLVTSAWTLSEFSAGISTTLRTGVIWLLVMGVANLGYLLGAASEVLMRPVDKSAYRRRMFALGFWFSFALPFAVPLILLADMLQTLGL